MSALSDIYGNYTPNLVSLAQNVPAVGGGGGSSAGNGAPTSNTPGVIYIQNDSNPPGLQWNKVNGVWQS